MSNRLQQSLILEPSLDAGSLSMVDSPGVRPADRLLSTLLYALAVHLVLLLGLQFEFSFPDIAADKPSLDITLVPYSNVAEPDQADFLAQANQQGGGESDKAAKPTTVLQGQQQQVEQQQTSVAVADVLETVTPQQVEKSVLAVEKSPAHQVPTEKIKPKQSLAKPKFSAAAIMRQSRQYARLQAQLADQQQAFAKRPRKKHVSAATKEYAYAAYLEAWRAKVERVGTLNYPTAARNAGITGSLRMAVEVDAKGRLLDIEISRSSGYPVLDKAAVRIVKQSAPFAPLSASITKETDVLVIVRTWQFTQDNALTSR
ncbi:MAG: energy transducer TonB [Immundisolibacteraceae bacterium]|nr:energy transducer TonB [Immundisolibacteraceae bacterium]